jgi:hypothetical protein
MLAGEGLAWVQRKRGELEMVRRNLGTVMLDYAAGIRINK